MTDFEQNTDVSLDPEKKVALKSVRESSFSEESGKEIDIYSCDVENLPAWFDAIGIPPNGYLFMGGVARGILLQQLDEFAPKPRDVDLVGIREFEPDTSLSSNVSAKFMPEDYSHGHGVGFDADLADYFSKRDFTINEVLYSATDRKIFYTRRALEDLRDKVIRPTESSLDYWNDQVERSGLSPKLAIKALVLQAEFMHIYEQGRVEGIEEWQWDLEGIPPFHLALGLSKALEKNVAIPFYLQVLDKSNISEENLPDGESMDNIKRLAYYVRRKMLLEGGDPFVFKDEELNVDPEVELLIENQWEKYHDLANQYPKRIKGTPARERTVRY